MAKLTRLLHKFDQSI